MAFEMRSGCERCNTLLTRDGAAWIGVVECTFCLACADALARMCPNRGDERVHCPRPSPQAAAA